jgi:8-oxo-dGTP diphosphatase
MLMDELLGLVQDTGRVGLVVAAVVTRGRGSRESVLLLRRRREGFLAGFLDLPGGKANPGETVRAALHREFKEETGLRLLRIKSYVGGFSYASPDGTLQQQLGFHVAVEPDVLVQVDGREHVDSEWVPLPPDDRAECTAETIKLLRTWYATRG